MHTSAAQEAWLDEHYPRCIRCGLRTYVNNFTGLREDQVTSQANCPAFRLPRDERPTYPCDGSRHVVGPHFAIGSQITVTYDPKDLDDGAEPIIPGTVVDVYPDGGFDFKPSDRDWPSWTVTGLDLESGTATTDPKQVS